MSSTSPTAGPYTAYQSAVNPNCWLVRFGTTGPVYEYQTPIEAANACDALNAAYLAGQASREQSAQPPQQTNGKRLFTESEVRAMLRDLIEDQARCDVHNGWQSGMIPDFAGIASKHGITLDPA